MYQQLCILDGRSPVLVTYRLRRFRARDTPTCSALSLSAQSFNRISFMALHFVVLFRARKQDLQHAVYLGRHDNRGEQPPSL
jgi:hypothetical protein